MARTEESPIWRPFMLKVLVNYPLIGSICIELVIYYFR